MNADEDYFDIKGYPICGGDLLRSYHYTGARGKKHYIYHVAVKDGGVWYAVPACHLEPTMRSGGGLCQLKYVRSGVEIISGTGPDPYLSFEDRPRQKAETTR